jgi:hypothetical protein
VIDLFIASPVTFDKLVTEMDDLLENKELCESLTKSIFSDLGPKYSKAKEPEGELAFDSEPEKVQAEPDKSQTDNKRKSRMDRFGTQAAAAEPEKKRVSKEGDRPKKQMPKNDLRHQLESKGGNQKPN